MGDINIVTQPTTDVPANLFTEQISKDSSEAAHGSSTQTSTSTALASSTAEQSTAASGVNMGLQEMLEKQSKLIEQMSQEIQLLKSGKTKSTMATNAETKTIEESMAEFFGYRD